MSILSVNRQEYESKLEEILVGLGYTGVIGSITDAELSLINYVKIKLDELIPEGEGITYALSTAPNTSNPIDMFIHSHLPESIKDVSLTAPINALYPVGITGDGTPFDTDLTYGFIDLPINFLRLQSFKMADWKRSISEKELMPIDGKAYKNQSSDYTRSGAIKPKAAINWKAGTTMNKVLEYYSILESHTVDKLYYIPSVVSAEYTNEDFILNNPSLLDSLAWMCAGKVMQITGQMDAFKLAMEQVNLSYTKLNV